MSDLVSDRGYSIYTERGFLVKLLHASYHLRSTKYGCTVYSIDSRNSTLRPFAYSYCIDQEGRSSCEAGQGLRQAVASGKASDKGMARSSEKGLFY